MIGLVQLIRPRRQSCQAQPPLFWRVISSRAIHSEDILHCFVIFVRLCIVTYPHPAISLSCIKRNREGRIEVGLLTQALSIIASTRRSNATIIFPMLPLPAGATVWLCSVPILVETAVQCELSTFGQIAVACGSDKCYIFPYDYRCKIVTAGLGWAIHLVSRRAVSNSLRILHRDPGKQFLHLQHLIYAGKHSPLPNHHMPKTIKTITKSTRTV